MGQSLPTLEVFEALFAELGLLYDKNKIVFRPHPRAMSERCACRKPSPYLILELCIRCDVSPSEVIFIGGSETDAESAIRAGCHFIHVDNTRGHYKTIDEIIHIIDSQTDLSIAKDLSDI